MASWRFEVERLLYENNNLETMIKVIKFVSGFCKPGPKTWLIKSRG